MIVDAPEVGKARKVRRHELREGFSVGEVQSVGLEVEVDELLGLGVEERRVNPQRDLARLPGRVQKAAGDPWHVGAAYIFAEWVVGDGADFGDGDDARVGQR